MRPNRHHLTGALAALVVIVALLVAAYTSNNLRFSGAAVKTASTSFGNFGALQAKTHRLGPATAPFLGPYRKGNCGPGVKLMEGALRHLRIPVRTSKPSKCFGTATHDQVVKFQKRLHYKPTGVYNLATHRQLVKRNGYSKQAQKDLVYLYGFKVKRLHVLLVQHERRTVQIAAAHISAVGDGGLPYTQAFPQRTIFPAWPGIPHDTDCSGMATFILYQAGVGSTVGYYGPGSPVGWTGTLRTQGQRISYGSTNTRNLQPGDLVFYGSPPNWGHVATYIGSGLVISHGGVGVNILRFDYRTPGEIRRYIF